MTVALADQTLGDLVTERPEAARVLDGVGLDYCCRGGRTLRQACADAGLDADDVASQLAAVGTGADASWADLTPVALAEHLVDVHHHYLREELPVLDALAEKVEGVHGGRHPELHEVRRLVIALRRELEPHLDKEEQVLFPSIATLFAHERPTFPFGSIANPIRVMAQEHDAAGNLLEALRRTTGAYAVPADACASYRSLYERLEALEHDTHVHIHKENHVLFPAALRALNAEGDVKEANA